MRAGVVAAQLLPLLALACGTSREAAPPPRGRASTRATAGAPAPDWSWRLDSAAAAAGRCAPSSESVPEPGGARVGPGDYVLTLVATSGPRAGATVAGRLWLRPTSAADRSPRTDEGAPAGDTADHPLYGATDAALEAAGAPIGLPEGTLAPPRTSADPLYPGVLALAGGSEDVAGRRPPAVLVVGTLANFRARPNGRDGLGIGLWVRRPAGDGFAGTWRPYGIVGGGTGYFCADRVAR